MLHSPQPGDKVRCISSRSLTTPFKGVTVNLKADQSYEVLLPYPDGLHVYIKGTPGKWSNELFEEGKG